MSYEEAEKLARDILEITRWCMGPSDCGCAPGAQCEMQVREIADYLIGWAAKTYGVGFRIEEDTTHDG